MIKWILISAVTLFSMAALAGNNPHPAHCNAKRLSSACMQICEACASSFTVGEANVGDGFWLDCVRPIMNGTPQPPKATQANHPLPAAPSGGWSSVAAQCKASNPNWGVAKNK